MKSQLPKEFCKREEYLHELQNLVAANARHWRILSGKTREFVISDMPINEATLRGIENGTSPASLSVLARLAFYYQIPDISELFVKRPMPALKTGSFSHHLFRDFREEVMTTIRPMKPATAPKNLSALKFPLLVSPKIDGVRAMGVNGYLLSASLKPIRNQHVQSTLGNFATHGLDGELVAGDPTHPNCMQNTLSAVMSASGEPEFSYYVFDVWDNPQPYAARLQVLQGMIESANVFMPQICALPQIMVHDVHDLEEAESRFVGQGYEGIIMRCPQQAYKFGRSTLNEQGMVKLKRFEDAEAEVLGFEELLHNANGATINALGLTERSSHQANKHGKGVLGAFHVRDLATGVEFKVGAGMTQEQRQLLWLERDTLAGRIITYKFFPVGVKEKPRHPVFKGFRHGDDISE